MTALSEFIRQSWLFPVIQSVHILGIVALVGTIALVDLRLLGIALRRHTVADLAADLAPWTATGLLTVFLTGPLLFWADLGRYLNNPAFYVKLALLAAALAVHITLHRRAVQDAVMPSYGYKLPAICSLLLWSSVVLAGRAIADFDIRIV